jgi:putative membrane protein
MFAHGATPDSWGELWESWAWEPGILLPLLLSGCFYARGLWRFWAHGKVGRGIHVWEAWCFAGGWFALVVALVSPLHPWGRVLFSAHMTQHEVLMLVAAPLLVLGRPMIAFLKAMPGPWAYRLAKLANSGWWQRVWQAVTYPFTAWLIHGLVLWVWHAPQLFQATIDHEFVHALQHSSFLFSALLFWWAVMQGRQRAMGYGLAVLYMFSTALHSGLLGVLITFSGYVLYPPYLETTQSWGLTPLEDQQLGGLIMWVPAAIVYVIAGLAFFAGWVRASEHRVRQREQAASAPSRA